MKRLIVKYNSIFEKTERMEIEAKIRREWEERKAVFIPEGCDYEIIDDGVNETTIWLDQEIEKRKAAVPKAADEERYQKYDAEREQLKRLNCKHLADNGNCLRVGGFCLAVNEKFCEYEKLETDKA